MAWDDVISSKQIDSAYKAFLNKFTSLYDKIFLKVCGYGKIKNTKKSVDNKRICKIFKNSEISYKNYRKLFESIKDRAKSQYYSKTMLNYK